MLILYCLWFVLRAVWGRTASIRRWSVVYCIACMYVLLVANNRWNSVPFELWTLFPTPVLTILLVWLAVESLTYSTGGWLEDSRQR